MKYNYSELQGQAQNETGKYLFSDCYWVITSEMFLHPNDWELYGENGTK